MKKYELTDVSIKVHNKKLFRIKSLTAFSDVKVGELGGFVESENNLSHDGFCWIYHNAEVYDNATVSDNAIVCNNAAVFGNAKVYDDCEIYGFVEIYDNARVYGKASIYDDAKIYGNSQVFGLSKIRNYVEVYGNAMVYGMSRIYDNVKVFGNISIANQSCLFKNMQASKFIINLPNSSNWSITAVDEHIVIGEDIRTYNAWAKWLNEDDGTLMKRNTVEFKKVQIAIKYLIGVKNIEDQETDKNKVYCKNCKHVEQVYDILEDRYCQNPNKHYIKHNAYYYSRCRPVIDDKIYGNGNNDCMYFEENIKDDQPKVGFFKKLFSCGK